MNFKQIVYSNDKPIIITNDTGAYLSENAGAASYEVYDGVNAGVFTEILSGLESGSLPGAIVREPSPEALIAHLGSIYRIIQAGGGLVYNSEGQILMIFRRGKWDLPKGKLDEGETIQECSLREVSEETGIGALTLGHKICETWHIYNEKSKNLVKHTTWFKMTSTDTNELVPQAEEDISEVLWVSRHDLAPYVTNTYHAIKDVLAREGLL